MEELDILLQRLENNQKFYAGYPPNTSFDYSPLFPFLQYPLNNIGDPFGPKAYFGTHEYEKAVIEWFLKLFKKKSTGWGYVTSGGTEGILFGLWNGREKLQRPIIYCSEATHYAVPKSARLLNLPCQFIPTDKWGEIDYVAFEESLISGRDALIVLNMGTLMTAAVDNIHLILTILKKKSIQFYIHGDAAIYGMVLPFISTHLPFTLAEGFDSISISGHKVIGGPLPCGVVLTNHNYIFSQEKIEILELHEATITGSRNGFTPLMLWYAIKQYGKSGFEKLVKESLSRAEDYCEKFNSANIQAWRFPHSFSVVLHKWPSLLTQKWRVPSDKNYTTLTALPKLTLPMVEEIIEDIKHVEKYGKLSISNRGLWAAKEINQLLL